MTKCRNVPFTVHMVVKLLAVRALCVQWILLFTKTHFVCVCVCVCVVCVWLGYSHQCCCWGQYLINFRCTVESNRLRFNSSSKQVPQTVWVIIWHATMVVLGNNTSRKHLAYGALDVALLRVFAEHASMFGHSRYLECFQPWW